MTVEERDELERALQGLDYPAPRNKLVSLAVANQAPQQVIDRLMQLEETADFMTEDDLRNALGVTVPGERPEGGWE